MLRALNTACLSGAKVHIMLFCVRIDDGRTGDSFPATSKEVSCRESFRVSMKPLHIKTLGAVHPLQSVAGDSTLPPGGREPGDRF